MIDAIEFVECLNEYFLNFQQSTPYALISDH